MTLFTPHLAQFLISSRPLTVQQQRPLPASAHSFRNRSPSAEARYSYRTENPWTCLKKCFRASGIDMVIAYRGRKGRMVEAGAMNLGWSSVFSIVDHEIRAEKWLTCQIPRMILGARTVSQLGYCSMTPFMSENNLVGSFSTLQSICYQLDSPFRSDGKLTFNLTCSCPGATSKSSTSVNFGIGWTGSSFVRMCLIWSAIDHGSAIFWLTRVHLPKAVHESFQIQW